MCYRESGFKLEQFHGTNTPNENSREANIRNYLFKVRMLQINHTRTEQTKIRLIGYEVPLYSRGQNRDECIDLLGYDEHYNAWIIELKVSTNNENLKTNVIPQVERYATAFANVQENIEKEVREKLFWPEFSLKGSIYKMILADRVFYDNKVLPQFIPKNLYLCSYSKILDEGTLMEDSRDIVRLTDMAKDQRVYHQS